MEVGTKILQVILVRTEAPFCKRKCSGFESRLPAPVWEDCIQDEEQVNIINYALVKRPDGQWAALFTAANKDDAQVGGLKFSSDWFETREEAEAKIQDVCEDLMAKGLKCVPLRPEN